MSKDKNVYEIVEANEVNSLESKLVKKNVDVEFTMQQMLDYERSADKMMIEYRGKLNIEDAKMQNVIEHHDDAISLVRDLDPVKQNAILIWLKSKEIIDQLAPKRDELQKAIDEHKAEIEEIKKQTGWEPPVLPDNEPDNADTKEPADEAGGESPKG